MLMITAPLSTQVNVKSQLGTFNRLFLNYWCHSNENFYGFGTQVTTLQSIHPSTEAGLNNASIIIIVTL